MPGNGTRTIPSIPYIRLTAYYWFYLAAVGVLLAYWGPYLKHLGFDATEIGELMGILMATRIVAPLAAAWVADRTGRPMALVRLACFVVVVTFAGVFFGDSYRWLALVMVVFSFFWSSVLAPFEVVTLRHLGRQVHHYGLVRLWGSLGFIAAVVGVGWVLELHGEGLVPAIAIGFFAVVALTSLLVPDAPPGAEQEGRASIRVLPPQVVALLAVIILMLASHGPYYTFFSIYLDIHGYAKGHIGLLWALGVIAEVVIFLAMSRLLPRVGARWLFLASLALTSLRWLLIGGFVDSLPVLLFAQLLHAASYGVFHAVVINYVNYYFTGARRTLGQALYASLGYGVGGAIGSVVSGHVWATISPSATFLLASVLPGLGFIIALIWIDAEPGSRRP